MSQAIAARLAACSAELTKIAAELAGATGQAGAAPAGKPTLTAAEKKAAKAAEAPKAPAVDYEKVKAAVGALAVTGEDGKAKIRSTLAAFNVGNAKDLKAEQYQAFIDALKADDAAGGEATEDEFA